MHIEDRKILINLGRQTFILISETRLTPYWIAESADVLNNNSWIFEYCLSVDDVRLGAPLHSLKQKKI